MWQSHEVHHFSHIKEPILIRVDPGEHGFAHQSSKRFVKKSRRVVPIALADSLLVHTVLDVLDMGSSIGLLGEGFIGVIFFEPINTLLLQIVSFQVLGYGEGMAGLVLLSKLPMIE